MLEQKINENYLERAYKDCYTNNSRLLEVGKLWEKTGIESWLKYEKGFYKSWNKSVRTTN
jgi:hypothetical protein